MQRGFIKFLKPYKLSNRKFKKDEIVSVDEIQLTIAQFNTLICDKAVVWAANSKGMCYAPSVTKRN